MLGGFGFIHFWKRCLWYTLIYIRLQIILWASIYQPSSQNKVTSDNSSQSCLMWPCSVKMVGSLRPTRLSCFVQSIIHAVAENEYSTTFSKISNNKPGSCHSCHTPWEVLCHRPYHQSWLEDCQDTQCRSHWRSPRLEVFPFLGENIHHMKSNIGLVWKGIYLIQSRCIHQCIY